MEHLKGLKLIGPGEPFVSDDPDAYRVAGEAIANGGRVVVSLANQRFVGSKLRPSLYLGRSAKSLPERAFVGDDDDVGGELEPLITKRNLYVFVRRKWR